LQETNYLFYGYTLSLTSNTTPNLFISCFSIVHGIYNIYLRKANNHARLITHVLFIKVETKNQIKNYQKIIVRHFALHSWK